MGSIISLVLEALVELDGAATTREISDRIEQRQSDVCRIMSRLAKQGYLDKSPVEGRRGYVTMYVLIDDEEGSVADE